MNLENYSRKCVAILKISFNQFWIDTETCVSTYKSVWIGSQR